MFKELKIRMPHQIKNISKEIEIISKNQVESLELKIIVIRIKNLLEGLNSKFELAEKRIRHTKDRLIKIMQYGEEKKERMKVNSA